MSVVREFTDTFGKSKNEEAKSSTRTVIEKMKPLRTLLYTATADYEKEGSRRISTDLYDKGSSFEDLSEEDIIIHSEQPE